MEAIPITRGPGSFESIARIEKDHSVVILISLHFKSFLSHVRSSKKYQKFWPFSIYQVFLWALPTFAFSAPFTLRSCSLEV